ncbi:GNAT family N-acetyltransferase [Flagellimonas allohymeniacidonis]|uniref:GNAT family N-acetyltransferase n=1 Tax=Flagellimonas allohymeniacidonis TaxID=2517819 RepID=A0A4Q8QKC4_9FLAO|nr:GNAT family N-acetyltransferase [Allomuricauda hymeniacidonis]TAI49233.1 GNAT family N-acetyltransferase [Allomuricauda hymeniacidonis]
MTRNIDIQIVPYSEKFKKAFKDLNEEWIREYFKMEELDHKYLDRPETYILQPGGYIGVALHQNQAVGVCALIKSNDDTYDFELSKMGVSPKIQGQGIGWLLGEHIVEEAKRRGAKTIYLDSNTVLEPAIKLYRKLGFVEVQGYNSFYERCNIRMELKL